MTNQKAAAPDRPWGEEANSLHHWSIRHIKLDNKKSKAPWLFSSSISDMMEQTLWCHMARGQRHNRGTGTWHMIIMHERDATHLKALTWQTDDAEGLAGAWGHLSPRAPISPRVNTPAKTNMRRMQMSRDAERAWGRQQSVWCERVLMYMQKIKWKKVYCADNEFHLRSQCVSVKCVIGRVAKFN